MWSYVFFFQAEDGIRDLVRSRGLGDVYKRQIQGKADSIGAAIEDSTVKVTGIAFRRTGDETLLLSLIHI